MTIKRNHASQTKCVGNRYNNNPADKMINFP